MVPHGTGPDSLMPSHAAVFESIKRQTDDRRQSKERQSNVEHEKQTIDGWSVRSILGDGRRLQKVRLSNKSAQIDSRIEQAFRTIANESASTPEASQARCLQDSVNRSYPNGVINLSDRLECSLKGIQ